MRKRHIAKRLSIILLSVLLLLVLCMCSSCEIVADSAEFTYYDWISIDNNKELIDAAKPVTTPKTTPFESLLTYTELVETITTPESIESTEPKEPETSYYDIPLSEDLQDHIFELCEERDIDPELVIAVIWRESRFKAKAVGDNGNSLGLMQIQPRWHSERMDRLDCPDLLDPYQNITVGIDILDDLFDSGKSVEWVLMAYNGGRSYANRNVKAGKISSYAKNVLNYRDELIKEE